MIAVLIDFQLIELAYVPQVDPQRHILLEQKAEGVLTVVKEGVAFRKLFQAMLEVSGEAIQEEVQGVQFSSPLFVCFSAKGKSITQPIFQRILPEFQSKMMYFNIDKGQYGELPFHRALAIDRQICFGQGLAKLRQKQVLRIALTSAVNVKSGLELIFMERSANQIKQLKKEGQTLIVDDLSANKFQQAYSAALKNLESKKSSNKHSQGVMDNIEKYPFAGRYLESLSKLVELPLRQIHPFNTINLTIKGLLSQLHTPSVYYNISPKSWVSSQQSKSVSSFVFHNASDSQLYIARSSRPKQFSNEEDYELKVVTYFLGFIVDPSSMSVPHDKHSTLMKFSKIKAFENKKSFMNIRPYFEKMITVAQLGLGREDFVEIIQNGTLFGRRVRGLGGIILAILITNESFNIKTISEQIALLQKDKTGESFTLVEKHSLRSSDQQLWVCRTDYFNPFAAHNYKLFSPSLLLSRSRHHEISFQLQSLNKQHTTQMLELLQNINEERMLMLKNVFLYYRWTTNMTNIFNIIHFRISLIRQFFGNLTLTIQHRHSLLLEIPQLVSLLIPQNYDRFMLPVQNKYFNGQFEFNQQIVIQKTRENPYQVYLTKTCSFAVYDPEFPLFSFLQWVKATNRYQIIEYISMINRSLEEYQILDKRLKLSGTNDKKNVLLVVDHSQLCSALASKVKSVKTVLVYRLKKGLEAEELGLVIGETERKNSLEESGDQTVSTLLRWSSPFFTSKFELYSWVLESFMKVKCCLYNIDWQQLQKFILSLHGRVATNKNRHKELEQAFGHKIRNLYALPIIKQQQKVLFNYKLFEFLYVKVLFGKIIRGEWDFKLATYQNASIVAMRPLIDEQWVTRVVSKLRYHLDELGNRNIPGDVFQRDINDILQVIRSLTYSQGTAASATCQLFHSLFLNQIKIHSFFEMRSITKIGKHLAVQDGQAIQLISKESQLNYNIAEDDRILAMNSIDNKLLMLLVNDNASPKMLIFSELEISSESLSNNVSSRIQVEEETLVRMACEEVWSHILVSRQGSYIYVVFHRQNHILVITVNCLDNSVVSSQSSSFDKKVHYLQLINVSNSLQLVLCDYQSVWLASLAPNGSKLCFDKVVSVSYGIENVYTFVEGNRLHIVLHKLHLLELYALQGSQVSHKITHNANRHIRTVAVQAPFLYVLYNDCQALDIFDLTSSTIDKVRTYHWVDPSPISLFISDRHLFLRGASYLKHFLIEDGQDFHGKNGGAPVRVTS